ncbi:MAG: alpha/beta fold hydrolase, partial [Thermomicrobiales bacterium]
AGDLMLTVETEKAVNDVEAPADGVVLKIVAGEGSDVPVMGPVAVIVAPGETVSDDEIEALIASAGKSGPKSAASSGASAGVERERRTATRDATGRVNASPAARRRAEELGVDLGSVEATGPGGRITSEDIERAAAAASAAPKAVSVRTSSGLTIQGLVAGPETASRKIVFVHGLGGSQTTWTTVLGEFVGEARVAALDLPGHGLSDKPDSKTFPYTIDALADAVGDAIAELGLAPAVIVGHSLGGAVAMHLAHKRPKAVSGLVLIASAGLGKEISGQLLDLVEAEPTPAEARGMLELFFEDKKLILDRGVNDMHQARLQPGADAAMKSISTAVFSRDGQISGLDDRLEDVNVPTLIVWGAFDRVVPVGHAARAAERIKGSWLEVMSGIGHVPQVEAPARLTETIKRWMKMAGPEA